jgi:hypothetical protein
MRPAGIVGAALLVVVAAAVTFGASCGGTPTPAPLRTFAQPQKVDFVCMQVNDASGNPIAPVPALPGQCPPVPPNVVATGFAFHYYALVTQTTRGELAVVDLTGGFIVDEDRSTPGVNFIPVGSNPTDVAVTPDGKSTYVASADPSLPAIYGVDNRNLLGDSQTLTPRRPALNNFAQIAACRLPQRPAALAILPLASTSGDGGASDAGTGASSGYALVALLRSQTVGEPAQVVVVEPPTQLGGLAPCTIIGQSGGFSSSLSGASLAPGPTWSDGLTYADAGDLAPTEPSPGPGCTWPPANGLGTASSGVGEGGAPDAGSALTDAGAPVDAGPSDAAPGAGDAPDGATDDGAVTGDASPDAGDAEESDAAAIATQDAGTDGSPVIAPGPGLSFGPLADPQPTSMVFRDGTPPVVYVADGAVPLIHIIDLTNPAQPREVSSLLATSQTEPTKRVPIGALALSPATRDYKQYLYAIDSSDGSLMVFDVTTAVPPPFTPPLQRPHAELNPFTPRDRISFAAPVSAVTFAYDEWPLTPDADAAAPALAGLLCNPSPNARLDGGAPGTGNAAGAGYCADQALVVDSEGAGVQGFPSRLRGLFAFATLTNGNVAVVDLDDWDAPCRRPDPMTPGNQTGVLALPQPAPTGPTDLDPYHVPVAFPAGLLPSATQSSVTQEPFYPVSAPNRLRSNFLLRNDPTSGIHVPYVLSTPQLIASTGAPLSADPTQPIILPTVLLAGFVDPASYTSPIDPHDNYLGTPTPAPDAAAEDAGEGGAALASLTPGSANTVPGIRIAFDDPTAHIDQDWWVTYEGALPSTSPLEAEIDTTTGYQNLTLSVGGNLGASDGGADASSQVASGGLCEVGIEDFSIGQERAAATAAAMKAKGLTPSATLSEWTSDYIEITDDLLPQNDCYWQEGLAGEGGLSGGCATGTTPPEPPDCWQGFDLPVEQSLTSGKSAAFNRYNICQQTFGPPDNPVNGPYSQADNYLLRDFPIIEAYDDHLVVGRFQWNPSDPACAGGVPERTTNRSVVGADPNNAQYFKLAQCCFHHQAGFKVRTGGEWAVVGQNGLGFLHHVQTDPSSGRCVLSCDPLDALKNARAFDVPYADPAAANPCAPPTAQIDRGDPLAFRNPMFSFVVWQGCSTQATGDAGMSPAYCSTFGDHTTSQRDQSWRFSMRGGFTPLSFSLGGAASAPVVPQSLRAVPSFQQLAIVDGAGQGLILIDLHTLAFAHDPYF